LEETDLAGCWKGSRVPNVPETLGTDEDAKAVYHDPDITPVEHHRLLVRTCMDAARASGAEVEVLPCGGPHLQNTGLFTLNVCSPDGSWAYRGADWEGTKPNWRANPKTQAQNLAYRYYMHNNLWTLDREGYCVSDPRPLSEAIIDICSAALSGGMALNGDDLPYITEERLQIIARCQPFYGVAARPVGLFEEYNPTVWDLKVKTDFEKWDVAAVFNYANEFAEKKMKIDFAKMGLDKDTTFLAFDFWKSEFLGECKGSLTLPVAGRSMRLIGLREKTGHPQLLGTDVHYTMGAKELLRTSWTTSEKRLSLVYRCPRQAEGKLFIYVPEGWKLKKSGPFMSYQCENIDKNVLAITVPFSPDLTSIDLEFN